MTDASDIVIGSGPAGVAVASALLARGRRVLMLDGGKRLEPEAEVRRAALAGKAALTEADREAWRAGQFAGTPGQVRRYGSDFAMEPAGATLTEARGFALRSSRAVGGLSNLWGAAVLPYAQKDIADWPVSTDDLAPHYRAVAALMPVSGVGDDLQALFPVFPMAGNSGIAPSAQGAALLARLAAHRDRLAATGVHAGAARHAVSVACRRCGLCLHGCPWHLIWSARQALPQLLGLGMAHRTGVVERFEEQAGGVRLHLSGGEVVTGARVFVAAGVLETARIVLASQPVPGELTLLDSQQAFLPMLHRWRAPVPVDQPPLHTLPQVFVEIDDAGVSPRLVHAQIYSWNEYYRRDLMAGYGRRLPGSGPLWSALARRLLVAQLFLHSDHSGRVGLRLAAAGRLRAEVRANAASGPVLALAADRLAAAMRRAGMVALRFALRPGEAGASFHAGGTVPMARTPVPGQADRLGRPFGLSRVHLVDASVLPSIPATTITFSVMANAHRIGAEAPA